MNNKFEIIYLLGQDNLRFKKKDEFVIYQGSHGDKGAEIADIIFPGAAYTEQNGYFTNLEGKIQKAFKASYPPGEAKEDWQIINDLTEVINTRKLFNDKEELESSMFNYLKLKKEKQNSDLTKLIKQNNFENENLNIKFKDYYFSNVIARSSKTMLDCNNSKIDIKKTGTEGKIMEYVNIIFQEVYKILFLLVPVLVTVAMIVWLDRRVWAFVQKRQGPNVVGPFGLLQSLADALKYIFKEVIIPASSNKIIFILAPIITMTLALIAWAVIPFSEDQVLANINVGILYIFAVSSLGVYGIIMGGWASNSKYPFLGAIRSAAQMVSYEVSIGIIIINVLLCVGSLNLNDIVISSKKYVVYNTIISNVCNFFYISFSRNK